MALQNDTVCCACWSFSDEIEIREKSWRRQRKTCVLWRQWGGQGGWEGRHVFAYKVVHNMIHMVNKPPHMMRHSQGSQVTFLSNRRRRDDGGVHDSQWCPGVEDTGQGHTQQGIHRRERERQTHRGGMMIVRMVSSTISSHAREREKERESTTVMCDLNTQGVNRTDQRFIMCGVCL